jgi:anaerobic magnesium-protoporphyrin IX monomethyl ester cyclase
MPDILLIQPPVRDFYLTAKRTIPYGLTCIASALMDSGFSVAILDGLATSKSRVCKLPDEMSYLHPYYGRPDLSPFALFHHFRHYGYSFDTIGKKAAESGAFLVGISSLFTPYAKEAIRMAEAVKARLPNAKIVLGGHHPSAMPQPVMESAAVDFVIRGEGEAAMPLLAAALSKGSRYDAIPGLVFRKKDGTIQSNPPARMQNLDDYPLPAAGLINQKFYSRKNGASAVIVASRGCPLKCSYCSFGNQPDLSYRIKRVDTVIREIERFADQNNTGFIDFEDENLSLDRRWFLRLLNEISDRFGQARFELRAMNGLYPPSLDEEVVGAMKTAGFKTLNLSLGSTGKQQLNQFNRADVSSAFDRTLKLAERYELSAVGYVICAAPFQRVGDSVADLLFLAGRRVLAGVSVFYPAPGSKDFELCEKHGLLPDHFACMRSSALPLSHTTSRKEAATLLRLARILNFMKSLLDAGTPIPDASAATIRIDDPDNRIEIGKQLLAKFLHDGRIRGVTPRGEIYDHLISASVSREFVEGLAKIKLKGTR